jgi:hypothetical protein
MQKNAISFKIREDQHAAMLNVISFLRAILPRPVQWMREAASEAGPWECDPLAHPALQRMSPEELADLPFDRESYPPPTASACGIGRQ